MTKIKRTVTIDERVAKKQRFDGVPRSLNVKRSSLESKYILSLVGSTVVPVTTGTAVFVPLNLCALGTDSISARIGRRINLKAMQIRLGLSFPLGAGALASNNLMWAIVYDRQPNGALPTFTDCFSSPPNSPGLALRSEAFYPERFQVLLRKDMCLTLGDSQFAAFNEYINLEKLLKGKDRHTNYNGTTALIASIGSGAVYFIIAGCTAGSGAAESAVGLSLCTYTFTNKLRFTDA